MWGLGGGGEAVRVLKIVPKIHLIMAFEAILMGRQCCGSILSLVQILFSFVLNSLSYTT